MFPSKYHYSTVALCKRCSTQHHADFNCQSIKCLYCHQIHILSDFQNGVCPNISEIIRKEKRKTVIKCTACDRKQQRQQSGKMVLRKKKCSVCFDKGQIYRFTFCCHSGCAKCNFECLKQNEQWASLKKIMKQIDVINEQDRDCPICLEVINKNQPIYKLQCEHIFHKNCAVNWLKITKFCPICRKVDTYFPYEPEKVPNNNTLHRAFIIEVIGGLRVENEHLNVPNSSARELFNISQVGRVARRSRSRSPPSPSSSSLERALRRRFGVHTFDQERTNSIASSISVNRSPAHPAARLSPSHSRSLSRSNSPIRRPTARLSPRSSTISPIYQSPLFSMKNNIARRSRSVSRSNSRSNSPSSIFSQHSSSPSRSTTPPQRSRRQIQNSVEQPQKDEQGQHEISIEDTSKSITSKGSAKKKILHSFASQSNYSLSSNSRTRQRSRQNEKKKRILNRKKRGITSEIAVAKDRDIRESSSSSSSSSKSKTWRSSSSSSGREKISKKRQQNINKDYLCFNGTPNQFGKCLWNRNEEKWIPSYRVSQQTNKDRQSWGKMRSNLLPCPQNSGLPQQNRCKWNNSKATYKLTPVTRQNSRIVCRPYGRHTRLQLEDQSDISY